VHDTENDNRFLKLPTAVGIFENYKSPTLVGKMKN